MSEVVPSAPITSEPIRTEREALTQQISALFKMSLRFTTATIMVLAMVDFFFLATRTYFAGSRLITEHVLMAFLAAILLQLAAVVAGMLYAMRRETAARPGGV